MPYNTPIVMITAMIPKAIRVENNSSFLIVLDVVLVAKIVKVSVLICRDMGECLVGFFAVYVDL